MTEQSTATEIKKLPKNSQELQQDPIYQRAAGDILAVLAEHHNPKEIHECISEAQKCLFHAAVNQEYQFTEMQMKVFEVLQEINNVIGIGIMIEESKQYRALGR